MAESLPRVMWLMNHTSTRQFEVAMLRRLGFLEVFLPKTFPQDVRFRGSSVDASEDALLSIPAADLTILNETDWYTEPPRDVWQVVNRHFDLIFFSPWSASFLRGISRHFLGAGILRGYGLAEGKSYSKMIVKMTGGMRTLENMGRRFWFSPAHDRYFEKESEWFQDREISLPLGLYDSQPRNDWTGNDPRILFVCPDLEQNPSSRLVYREFRQYLASLPYAVAGPQSLATNDPNVLGFVSEEQHQSNMREFRVMFYHRAEHTHIHQQPLEAVRSGMPVVFMAGGMLDRLGGSDLPGRCRTYDEARSMLGRILKDDRQLIDRIRTSQAALLARVRPEALEPVWRESLSRVLSEGAHKPAERGSPQRRTRIAIVLPVRDRGDNLRSAKLLAQAVWSGSRQAGEDADVVLAYPEGPDRSTDGNEPERWDAGLPAFVSRRTFRWQRLDLDSACRAMRYAGHPDWLALAPRYVMPDDGMHELSDCDLWIVLSDRLPRLMVPLRPYALMVNEYTQRSDFSRGSNAIFLEAARIAERVLVTTRFTERMVRGGVAREKVHRLPMLSPGFIPAQAKGGDPYFLWTTSLSGHKNHHNAIRALREYYDVLEGRLNCHISGVESAYLRKGQLRRLKPLSALVAQNSVLNGRVRILGELPDTLYRAQLAGASFLWHPAQPDNGNLRVADAAVLGVPSLSSRYPAMEETNERFDLNLSWMESDQPSEMALRLKWMEEHAKQLRAKLPSGEQLAKHGIERVAAAYWSVIRECL
jgi:glycosyltransferase involved in cell wall biosynthesis